MPKRKPAPAPLKDGEYLITGPAYACKNALVGEWSPGTWSTSKGKKPVFKPADPIRRTLSAKQAAELASTHHPWTLTAAKE